MKSGTRRPQPRPTDRPLRGRSRTAIMRARARCRSTRHAVGAPKRDNGACRGFRDRFNRAADDVTNALGSLPALVASVLLVVLWALTGPIFHFSDTWQLF